MRNLLLTVAFFFLVLTKSQAQKKVQYNIYRGNTHAHTSYTWSHGEHLAKSDCKGISVFAGDFNKDSVDQWKSGYVKDSACPAILIIRSSQYPGPGVPLKKDWDKVQNPPAAHYALAKKKGYDFYITTDHSQEYIFNPPSVDNPAWLDTKKAVREISDSSFTAIRGYEHSENNGPDGKGHFNVYNTAEYLNALDPEVSLQFFYNWLKSARPDGDAPVVACFNHPNATQYDDWAFRDDSITNIITTLEIINSNKSIHEKGYIAALDKGWKVSPVCGNDNHGLTGIKNHTSRTFILAEQNNKKELLDAMKHRRTYASLDSNIQCRYWVNGRIMGSDIPAAKKYTLELELNDPDTEKTSDRITKVEIVGEGGKIIKSYEPKAAQHISWKFTLKDFRSKYLFIKIWNEGGGDLKNADPSQPIAWLAPVWTQ